MKKIVLENRRRFVEEVSEWKSEISFAAVPVESVLIEWLLLEQDESWSLSFLCGLIWLIFCALLVNLLGVTM